MSRAIDAFDATNKVNMTDRGFKIAFGVNDFKSFESLDDPAYVEGFIKLTRGSN